MPKHEMYDLALVANRAGVELTDEILASEDPLLEIMNTAHWITLEGNVEIRSQYGMGPRKSSVRGLETKYAGLESPDDPEQSLARWWLAHPERANEPPAP